MLRSLVIEKNSSQAVDFSSEPWNDAALVTPLVQSEFSGITWHSGKCVEKADSPFLSAEQKIRSEGGR